MREVMREVMREGRVARIRALASRCGDGDSKNSSLHAPYKS